MVGGMGHSSMVSLGVAMKTKKMLYAWMVTDHF